MIDLTVAVTAHDETLIAGPSMHSAEEAISAVEAEGYRVERIIGIDVATDECRAFFSQQMYSDWRIVECDFADPFKTRNAIVEMASGRWISFLDADDLFSKNWLITAARRLKEAETAGEKIIVHPELNWLFENAEVVFVKPPQRDDLFTPYYLYFQNYYDMLCMAPRSAALEIPYGYRDLTNGFGYQDWQWNIETMAAGWIHEVVKDTVIFKRRRDTSVSVENMQRSCVIRSLEPMAIDNIRKLGF